MQEGYELIPALALSMAGSMSGAILGRYLGRLIIKLSDNFKKRIKFKNVADSDLEITYTEDYSYNIDHPYNFISKLCKFLEKNNFDYEVLSLKKNKSGVKIHFDSREERENFYISLKKNTREDGIYTRYVKA